MRLILGRFLIALCNRARAGHPPSGWVAGRKAAKSMKALAPEGKFSKLTHYPPLGPLAPWATAARAAGGDGAARRARVAPHDQAARESAAAREQSDDKPTRYQSAPKERIEDRVPLESCSA